MRGSAEYVLKTDVQEGSRLTTATCSWSFATIIILYKMLLRVREKIDMRIIQESPAVADKPARRLRKVCTVYVRAVGL